MHVAHDIDVKTSWHIYVPCLLCASASGPLLLSDSHLLDKLSHLTHERLSPRLKHANVSLGVHGYFECTKEMDGVTRAGLFTRLGRRTPVFVRFSTEGGGHNTTDRSQVKGMAIKHYTEDGNFDMVASSSPVYFLRDPLLVSDLVHSRAGQGQGQGSGAGSGCHSPRVAQENLWQFLLSRQGEMVHATTLLHARRNSPRSYRFLHSYGVHTFQLHNQSQAITYAKFHYRPVIASTNAQEQHYFSVAQAQAASAENPAYMAEELYDHLSQKGGEAVWEVSLQLIPAAAVESNPLLKQQLFDPTRTVSLKKFPRTVVGRLVLNKNVRNHFAETEQASFNPGNLIPGISAPHFDRILQARLFAYRDAAQYRLGVNANHIPVNCPYASRGANHLRDGLSNVMGNGGNNPSFYLKPTPAPASIATTNAAQSSTSNNAATKATKAPPALQLTVGATVPSASSISGVIGRFPVAQSITALPASLDRGEEAQEDDFSGARRFFLAVLSDADRADLCHSLARSLWQTRSENTQANAMALFGRVAKEMQQQIKGELENMQKQPPTPLKANL